MKKIAREISSEISNKMNTELLKILVCPLCKSAESKLEYDEVNQELLCYDSKLAYPIKNGIPIMLVEEARKLIL